MVPGGRGGAAILPRRAGRHRGDPTGPATRRIGIGLRQDRRAVGGGGQRFGQGPREIVIGVGDGVAVGIGDRQLDPQGRVERPRHRQTVPAGQGGRDLGDHIGVEGGIEGEGRGDVAGIGDLHHIAPGIIGVGGAQPGPARHRRRRTGILGVGNAAVQELGVVQRLPAGIVGVALPAQVGPRRPGGEHRPGQAAGR